MENVQNNDFTKFDNINISLYIKIIYKIMRLLILILL